MYQMTEYIMELYFFYKCMYFFCNMAAVLMIVHFCPNSARLVLVCFLYGIHNLNVQYFVLFGK